MCVGFEEEMEGKGSPPGNLRAHLLTTPHLSTEALKQMVPFRICWH